MRADHGTEVKAMQTQKCIILSVLLVIPFITQATDNARPQYTAMTKLQGEWILSPANQQEGKATQHKLIKPLLGTDTTAMNFKLIGKGSTVQENLLPETGKEMVTMYHCKDTVCSQVKATHYCIKQNQPEMLVDPVSTDTSLVYNCDMSTSLCQSKQNHVHKITHELSNEGAHLKTTYTSYNNGMYMKDSIYHFDRK
jgi:hypothetical protein